MVGLWQQDIETLEAISQDEVTRRLLLRMATLSQSGRLEPMMEELRQDEELDQETRDLLSELASDPTFLLSVQDYLRRTHVAH